MERSRTPPGRYDEPRSLLSGPRRTVVAVVLGLAVVAAGYVLFARRTAAGATASVIGYVISSDTAIRIRFEVRRPVGRTAVCVVRALDTDAAEVGTEDVVIPASGSSTVRLDSLLTTTRRASTGEVGRCVLRG